MAIVELNILVSSKRLFVVGTVRFKHGYLENFLMTALATSPELDVKMNCVRIYVVYNLSVED